MFRNPYPDVLPVRVWMLLLQYVEHASCFKSGNWPDSGFRHVKRVSRKGHIVFDEVGPFLCDEHATGVKPEFGDRECDEVACCYKGLERRDQMLIELTVLGVVTGRMMPIMRCAAKDMKITVRHVFNLRQRAFERLAKACEEKGIG